MLVGGSALHSHLLTFLTTLRGMGWEERKSKFKKKMGWDKYCLKSGGKKMENEK